MSHTPITASAHGHAGAPSAATAAALDSSVGLQMKRITLLLGSAIDHEVEPLSLTEAQWKPLLRLLFSEPCSAAALAGACQLDAGGLTRMLDRLQAKGLCQRVRSAQDRRSVLISLTDEGRATAARLPPLLATVQAQLLDGFSQAEEAQLRDFLARMHANAQAMAGPPPT